MAALGQNVSNTTRASRCREALRSEEGWTLALLMLKGLGITALVTPLVKQEWFSYKMASADGRGLWLVNQGLWQMCWTQEGMPENYGDCHSALLQHGRGLAGQVLTGISIGVILLGYVLNFGQLCDCVQAMGSYALAVSSFCLGGIIGLVGTVLFRFQSHSPEQITDLRVAWCFPVSVFLLTFLTILGLLPFVLRIFLLLFNRVHAVNSLDSEGAGERGPSFHMEALPPARSVDDRPASGGSLPPPYEVAVNPALSQEGSVNPLLSSEGRADRLSSAGAGMDPTVPCDTGVRQASSEGEGSRPLTSETGAWQLSTSEVSDTPPPPSEASDTSPPPPSEASNNPPPPSEASNNPQPPTQ